MYLRPEVVRRAIDQFAHLHPFFGITFLVCKKSKLPVGSTETLAIDAAENQFLLEYYRPNLASKFYFQPFKTSKSGRWLSPRYSSTSSQKTRTAGLLAKAFLHKRNTTLWGWHQDYINVLQEKLELDKTGRVPAFWLATWLFRNRNFRPNTRPTDLVQLLLKEFFITDEERERLFQTTIPDLSDSFLREELFPEQAILKDFEPPPDGAPEEGGTLRELHLRNVGPVLKTDFFPAERVSIITGDNGLGKTFLLECCWWGLTGEWAEKAALRHVPTSPASIEFVIASKDDFPARKLISFDVQRARWPEPTKERPTIPGLVVYARVDGSFAVWDPARHYDESSADTPGNFLFLRDDVLNGRGKQINGLIQDWVRWQNAKDQSLFVMFCKVLERLSPPDMAPLVPSEPTRILYDSRDIPTLAHDYGVVPFINESAGVRRIVTIAYLLVWAWNEHRVHASFSGKAPQNHIVVMIDEIEAHLHPKWQRVILPALLDVTNLLSVEMKPQILVATHSPLILASMESAFSQITDKLFHLYLAKNSPSTVEVKLDEVEYFKHGSVDAWLTSDVFELKQARSQEGESALDQAQRLLASSSSDHNQIMKVHQALQAALPADDPFWPRWLHFATMKGVSL
jgi:hypothetical protein